MTRPGKSKKRTGVVEVSPAQDNERNLEAFTFDMTEHRRSRLERELDEAAEAYLADHFDEARKILAPMIKELPAAASVRELLGLSYYRLEDFESAARELEQFVALTGSLEQHPVLADCYRALKRWVDCEELCGALEDPDIDPELAIEGRIVAAGALADRGKLSEAIQKLSTRRVLPKEPQLHHLRRAYAVGDLYERAGDVPRARQYFVAIARVEPDFVDVSERLAALD